MEIRSKVAFYAKEGEKTYQVPVNTAGVLRDGVIYFYDITKTMAVGFSKNVCEYEVGMFHVKKTIEDRQVSLRDVLRVVSNHDISMGDEELMMKLKSL